MRSTLWILILCICAGSKVMSQCTPSSLPALTCNGTVLTSNTTINSGNYNVGSAGGTFNNVSLNGGRLIICGNATFNNFNFNSGQLIINTGAVVTFNSQMNTDGKSFYNYGNVTFGSNATLGGTFYNHTGAVITVKGTQSFLNGGTFYNLGVMNFVDVTVNSGSMCMGSGAQFNARNIFNNPNNFIKIPQGSACLSFEATLKGNGRITNSSDLRVCQKPGATTPSSAIAGPASVSANCVGGCSAALPLTLTGFSGTRKGDQAELNWSTSYEENVKAFYIEQSTNGRDYASIKEVPANNRPSVYRSTVALPKDTYFRLRMVDIDGTTTYSPIIVLQQLTSGFDLSVQSNPVRGANAAVVITTQQTQKGTLLVVDNSGRMIRSTPVSVQKGDNRVSMDLSGVNNGQYFLYYQGSQDRSKTVALIKM